MAKKCKTPKMSLGGNLLSYGGQGAGLGMSIGGPAGAAIGGGLGMIGGIFMNRAEKQAIAEAKRLQEEQIAKQQLAFNQNADRQILSSFPTTGVNQSYFKNGGKIENPKSKNNSVFSDKAFTMKKDAELSAQIEALLGDPNIPIWEKLFHSAITFPSRGLSSATRWTHQNIPPRDTTIHNRFNALKQKELDKIALDKVDAISGADYKYGGNIKKDNPLEGDLISKVLMNRNRNLNFVDRAYNPENYSPQINADGTKSTHIMAWGEDNTGQAYMFPTMDYNMDEDGKPIESIKVPNQYADYISRIGYKNATGMSKKEFTKGGSISPTMKLMDGKKHSQGGIPINYKGRKIEVEDDEVIDKQMDYVYSDKIYLEEDEINQLLQILNG